MTDINKALHAIIDEDIIQPIIYGEGVDPKSYFGIDADELVAKIKALVVESIKDEVPEKYDPNLSKELRNIKLEERRWLNMRNKLRGEIRSILNT